jgi:putative toxin-antitoxin system antitoxin component (TIGR02293 family)
MTNAPFLKEKEPISYAKLIGIKAFDRMELSEKVQVGFPVKAFISLTKTMELSNKQLAELVQISSRTLNRRLKEGILKADESERLLRFSRIFTMATNLFEGDSSSAQNWLTNSNRALGGESPLEASKTEEGSREVENLINRLEHGVFS